MQNQKSAVWGKPSKPIHVQEAVSRRTLDFMAKDNTGAKAKSVTGQPPEPGGNVPLCSARLGAGAVAGLSARSGIKILCLVLLSEFEKACSTLLIYTIQV